MSASLRRSPLPPCSCPSLVIGEPLASRPLRRRARITRLDRDPLDLIERYVLLVTFLLVIFRDLTEGILAGFGLGALLFLHRMAQSVEIETGLPMIEEDRADTLNGNGRQPCDSGMATDPDVVAWRTRCNQIRRQRIALPSRRAFASGPPCRLRNIE